MSKINYISVDTSKSVSDLCTLGAQYNTDKSPYNATPHRHPYTAVYDMIFASRRYAPISFAEVGVMHNASMCMWRSYFTAARLYGFDINMEFITKAKSHNLPNTEYHFMDANDPQSIFDALNDTGQMFDIIIDDSNHHFEQQVKIVSIAFEFLKAGGALIIEDIFRPWGEARYEEALGPYMEYFSSCAFIETNHDNRWSPGTEEPWFDNDKLLIMYRNHNSAPLRRVKPNLDLPYLNEARKRQGLDD